MKKIVGIDILKTDSSYHTMPLLPEIEEELLRERERQIERKEKRRSAYSQKWEDYVCVDAMGEIIKPQYFTAFLHFLASSCTFLKEHKCKSGKKLRKLLRIAKKVGLNR